MYKLVYLFIPFGILLAIFSFFPSLHDAGAKITFILLGLTLIYIIAVRIIYPSIDGFSAFLKCLGIALIFLAIGGGGGILLGWKYFKFEPLGFLTMGGAGYALLLGIFGATLYGDVY